MTIINKYTIVLGVFITLLMLLYSQYKQIERLELQYSNSVENIKAYNFELDKSKQENRVFKFTIEQLQYYNDSIMQKMEQVRKDLKLKDEKIKSMQYLISKASKKDSIIFRDTIFNNELINIDTIIGDQWYNLNLKLKYPNTIYINPSFISEKYIIVHDKKETIEPPKKFFLFRWFQKKQTVLQVNIIEKNPYIEEQESRYIQIIK